MTNISSSLGRRARRLLIAFGAAASVVGAAGCDSLLDADLPGRIPTDLLGDPTNAAVLAASVIADFECAYSNYVLSTAILSDQFLGASGNLTAKQWGTKNVTETDAPNQSTSCAGSFGAYTPLQTARYQAEDVVARLEPWTDAEAGTELAPLRARTRALGGYVYTFLGEGYCSMRFKDGPILTPAAVLAIAETKFTEAITAAGQASGSVATELLNLARVGRARVRLDLGNKTGAAEDAAAVSPGFEYLVTRSADATSRYNDAYLSITEQRHGSVDPAYRDLTVGGVPDPRVEVAFGPDIGLPAKSFDGVTDLYVVTNKNISRAAPMRLASFIEARLIQAEALGGQQAADLVNDRRAELSLPEYTGPVDAASIQALILDERNREFFMEGGHRLNDLVRYGIPWKVGNDQIGAPYGPATCMPLPQLERIAAGG